MAKSSSFASIFVKATVYLCLLITILHVETGQAKLCMTNDCVHERVQKCCHDTGERMEGRKECLKFCRFNVTGSELDSEGTGCLDHIQILLYCTSEGNDHTRCCNKEKVPKICAPFCRGDVTGLCPDQVGFDYHECIDHMDKIVKCHKQSLSSTREQWSLDSKSPRMKACSYKK